MSAIDIVSVKKQIDTLSAKIAECDLAFFRGEAPLVSDGVYDEEKRLLIALELEHPLLKRKDSPTTRIEPKVDAESEAQTGLKSVSHEVPMLSLAKAINDAEMDESISSISAEIGLGPDPTLMCLEYKLDGMAASLIYNFGRLVRGATRGDGNVGEDITHNILLVPGIPLQINDPEILKLPYFEVRGECYITHKDFNALNDLGLRKKPYVNPRNAAAGVMRKHTVVPLNLKHVTFGAYSAITDVNGGFGYKSHSHSLSALQVMGFNVPHYELVAGLEQARSAYARILGIRSDVGFDIDGLVFKVDDKNEQEQMGVRSNSPRWSFARKFPAYDAFTELLDVVFDVGRTGAVTPVAVLKPVMVGGVSVSSSTLHNMSEIRRLDLHIGDTVVITRAGDVIPKITAVNAELRPTNVVKIVEPIHCPHCGSELGREDKAEILRCFNIATCPAQTIELVKYATGRDVLNIKHFGDVLIEGLYEEGLIKNVPDVFKLTAEMLLRGGCKNGDVKKVLASIEGAKAMPFNLMISSFGIREIGITAGKDLADTFDSVEDLFSATRAQIAALPGFGDKMADNFVSFFELEESRNLARQYLDVGVALAFNKKVTDGPLSGQTWVMSGSFNAYKRREDAEALLESLGAKTSSSVSKKTHTLVAGPGAGSKLAKAEAAGVRVWGEDELLALFKEHNLI